jgi:hypothetical protein
MANVKTQNVTNNPFHHQLHTASIKKITITIICILTKDVRVRYNVDEFVAMRARAR